MKRRILVIDDDPLWRDTYDQELTDQGYEVILTATAAEGLARAILVPHPHVIILDQKLEGPDGRSEGIDFITPLVDASPSSRILMVTGYPDPASVEHAFGRGVSDYVTKDRILLPMLRQKVRQAADAAEHAMASSIPQREGELREIWKEARDETDPHRKGAALERTLQLLFTTIPGLHEARRDHRAVGEQIDVIVRNDSDDPFLAKQGALIVVECKNWSSTVGATDVRALVGKMSNKHGRCQLGILVSMNGFTSTAAEDLLQERRTESLVVLVDGPQLGEWLDASDRLSWLKDEIAEAAAR